MQVGGAVTLLGGSWVVITGVISPHIWITSIVTLLITLLITTNEPPSSGTNDKNGLRRRVKDSKSRAVVTRTSRAWGRGIPGSMHEP